MYNYFNKLDDNNDLSITSHIALACFVGAAHRTMLERLQSVKVQTVQELHDYWYQLMEQQDDRSERNTFFSEVVANANAVNQLFFCLLL